MTDDRSLDKSNGRIVLSEWNDHRLERVGEIVAARALRSQRDTPLQSWGGGYPGKDGGGPFLGHTFLFSGGHFGTLGATWDHFGPHWAPWGDFRTPLTTREEKAKLGPTLGRRPFSHARSSKNL